LRSLCFILFAVFAAEAKDLHWAYVSPTKPDLPSVKNAEWARNEIDFFCLSRMESRGHAPNERESSARLIRRVFLDLIGIPPSIENVDSFLLDPSDQHLEQIVDELLSSNHFGEKWALGWLDLARYADSDGYQRDGFRNVWPYRDWVIRARHSEIKHNDKHQNQHTLQDPTNPMPIFHQNDLNLKVHPQFAPNVDQKGLTEMNQHFLLKEEFL
jgi:hypothetical protein